MTLFSKSFVTYAGIIANALSKKGISAFMLLISITQKLKPTAHAIAPI